MIKSINDLLEQYQKYSDPIGKINRELKNENLYSVVKGIYETNRFTPGHFLTAYIYGPSYISFEYALYYHGLIPEKVVIYTNATFQKRKSKKYKNVFGTFTYRDVPKTAFPYGVEVFVEEGYSYFIATKEKALCDRLYIAKPQTSMKSLKQLMFDDLRIDENEFYNLDYNELLFLCDRYPSSNLKLLKKIIKREVI